MELQTPTLRQHAKQGKTTDMMVFAAAPPGGLTDPHFAWGDKWVRIVKHVKAPGPNAWSTNLARLEQNEQPAANMNRKPAGALWADADDWDCNDTNMTNPWGSANAGDWDKYSGAMAEQAWPSSGPPTMTGGAGGEARDSGYQPYDLTADDDEEELTPPTVQWDAPSPTDLAETWTPAKQANSDDNARKLRLQNAEAAALDKLTQKSLRAEEAALAEAAKDLNVEAALTEAADRDNLLNQLIDKINSDSRTFKAETERKAALLETTIGGLNTSLTNLVTQLSAQRTSDNEAVGQRISGLETQLTSISENMAILMTAVKGFGNGKGGPYGKDAGQGQGKSKTLIQVPEAAVTGGGSAAAAAASTDDASMDTTNSEQTKSAKLAEA